MTATPTPRLTYQTIGTFQRYNVLRKIAALAALEERGFNHGCGCCYSQLCAPHRQGIAEAIDRLMRYAVRTAS